MKSKIMKTSKLLQQVKTKDYADEEINQRFLKTSRQENQVLFQVI